jgi:hypothetical protein
LALDIKPGVKKEKKKKVKFNANSNQITRAMIVPNSLLLPQR